jgi:exodeoxyribonuclease V alpha subunit
MPVMITVNDHRLKLYNGDVGIVRQEGKSQKVYFPDSKKRGEFRNYTPNQLPEHEAVFAMTVHKSQGSGFQKILIIMPDKDSRLLTRELLYTAITRAEKNCEIWSYDSIIKKCISRKTERDSGLKDKLTIFSQP